MSATRLLVLGVVRGFGRTHGYRVRAELLSWGIDDWANVKPGSIYHALRQLAKDGLLEASEIMDWPGRVDYSVTPEGDEEFFRLLVDALERPERRDDTLRAGLALMPALSRDRAVAALSRRLGVLEAQRAVLLKESGTARAEGLPPQLAELWRMRMRYADLGVEWTRDLLERVSSGEYELAGEDRDPLGAPGSRHGLGAPSAH
ncbi:PadR family transcriptional regulator [Streptomyces sp. ID05-47C]|uniref:PadR family transcriptional regulator n=1 Tax=Streptomyces sp. ID05-47C TaxID=3028665 RepID=UPI0029AEECE7|nr:PadR family transcriptional regulator [Streptomyces sp. ID05-47C]MDX3568366.1 PadR family transcriptional regulator [Streptomyces sp. ID05-47C]